MNLSKKWSIKRDFQIHWNYDHFFFQIYIVILRTFGLFFIFSINYHHYFLFNDYCYFYLQESTIYTELSIFYFFIFCFSQIVIIFSSNNLLELSQQYFVVCLHLTLQWPFYLIHLINRKLSQYREAYNQATINF